MSRIGKLPIQVPAGVDVTIDGRTVAVKGPKGSLSHTVAAPIEVAKGEDGVLNVARPNDERQNKALHGLSRTLVANMITGVTRDTSRRSRSAVSVTASRRRAPTWSSPWATATRSWSRPPRASPSRSSRRPSSRVEGIDKQKVGEVAANIRKLRKPDPYKAKGVKYAGEVIRRKVGKAGK